MKTNRTKTQKEKTNLAFSTKWEVKPNNKTKQKLDISI